MPTYEYECAHCRRRFEVSQKITDKHLEKCPHCGQKPKRLISSGAGIIFKGSGFYATDYRKKGKADSTGGKGAAPSCPKANDSCGHCPHAQ